MNVHPTFFILISLISGVAAAHDTPFKETQNAVGLVFGKSIGSGLFYRYARDNYYFQLSGLYSPARMPVESNIGVAVGYIFHEESLLHVRVPINLHVYFAVNREYFANNHSVTDTSNATLKGMFYTSIGVALDIANPWNPHFGAMVGTSYGSRAHVRTGEYDYFDLNDGWVSTVSSIYYRW